MGFKENFNYDIRESESEKILNKYPSRIPVIVEKSKGCQLNNIDKISYNM